MAIEGPLQELGLPDVFQLLDLSRKTGMLRVSSRTLDDEGIVYFDGGRVVQAQMRSKPAAHLDAGLLTPRELERRLRGQIEGVVFALMNWREGFFSFEERSLVDLDGAARASIATESLLMESARRIDEWERIADKIPHLRVVPALAQLPDDHESQLDLLPHEWEVLSLIDGARDLRGIAHVLGRGDFEAAKVVYGLVTTGVVDIVAAADAGAAPDETDAAHREARRSLEIGFAAVRAANFFSARQHLERFLILAPDHRDGDRARSALYGISLLLNAMEGDREGSRHG